MGGKFKYENMIQEDITKMSFSDLEAILKHAGDSFKQLSRTGYAYHDSGLKEKADDYNHLCAVISSEMISRVERLVASVKEQFV